MVSGKQRLEGKVAIITGGGTGLGKIMALTLAKAGADIVVAARRAELIEQTAKEVRDLGRRGLAIPTDATDSQQVNRMVERTLSEMGRIDILINNAGGESSRRQIWDITDEEWHEGIDRNLTSAFFCCRAVSKHLVAQKSGKVINIASGWGLRGGKDIYMYTCSKGGVVQLTRTLALSWAQYNIQVNSLAPGLIDVADLQPPEPGAWELERRVDREKREAFMYVGRVGIPEDIAYQALFLASDASDYVTGALFAAEGGTFAGGYAPVRHAPIIALEEE